MMREEDGKWFRRFADPLYGRGYPSDQVRFTKMCAANGMDFVSHDLDVIATLTDFLGPNYYSEISTAPTVQTMTRRLTSSKRCLSTDRNELEITHGCWGSARAYFD
jgi:beta-glucosidase/6-phospho-beta-glucosidase/beta-galactosidase